MAVGDAQGNLRVLEIPRNFTVPLNNEHAMMISFYRKEHINTQFSCERKQILKVQTMINAMCEKKQNNESDEKEHEQQNQKNSNQEKTVEETHQDIEAKYQTMLASFKKKLGL